MQYEIQHTTIYRYSEPIRESTMELRMKPRSEESQNCLSFEILTSPAARVSSYVDSRGNHVHSFDIPTPHLQLEITARARVEVFAFEQTRDLPADPWAALDNRKARGGDLEWLLPSHFARATKRLAGLMTELGISRDLSPLDALDGLCSGLSKILVYEKNVTRVDSGIDESLTTRRGVCQDFAHIFIAGARSLGIPCRYVSGYLCTDLTGASAEANHAWAEAGLPGSGWLGFDPTNDTQVGPGYVRVGIGRDYRDVPPTRGTFQGNAKSDLSIQIQVRKI